MNATRLAREQTPHLPPRTETVDHYLETIYCIAAEGETVRPSRIADWLDVSAPTVSVALQRLARDGWIVIAPDRSVTLSAAGEAAAAPIIRRHRVLERWLTDVLGFDWASADVEAHRLSSGMSEDVLDRLDESLQHPSTCPHGNTIPGRTPPYGRLITLIDLERGAVGTVQRISEVAEHETPQLLQLLAASGMRLGSHVSIAELNDATDVVTVRIGDAVLPLAATTAQRIWVDAR